MEEDVLMLPALPAGTDSLSQ